MNIVGRLFLIIKILCLKENCQHDLRDCFIVIFTLTHKLIHNQRKSHLINLLIMLKNTIITLDNLYNQSNI